MLTIFFLTLFYQESPIEGNNLFSKGVLAKRQQNFFKKSAIYNQQLQ